MRWDRQFYLIGQTPEAYGLYGPSFGGKPLHPLIGTRLAPGGAEWRQIISLETHPYLAGHKVDGEAILPATAFMEMVAALGREVHGTGRLRILDLDILRPMTFEPGGGREVSLIWNEADRTAPPARVGKADSIKREVEASLKRLGVERIDLYQMHWPSQDGSAIEEYWQAFLDLKRDGKVRAIGLSNETSYGVHEFVRLAEQHGLPRIASVQKLVH
eukprot:gene11194-13695_t